MSRRKQRKNQNLNFQLLEPRVLLAGDLQGQGIAQAQDFAFNHEPEEYECTLRDAIHEANSSPSVQRIVFYYNNDTNVDHDGVTLQMGDIIVNSSMDYWHQGGDVDYIDEDYPRLDACRLYDSSYVFESFPHQDNGTIFMEGPIPKIREGVKIVGNLDAETSERLTEINGSMAMSDNRMPADLVRGEGTGFIVQETETIGTTFVGTTFQDLSITEFKTHGIHAVTGNNTFIGNHIGANHEDGIRIESDLNAIGGIDSPEDRMNLISGNNGNGIHITGNYNFIGSTDASQARNSISGNVENGIRISGDFNEILGNDIGTDLSDNDVGNGLNGIKLAGNNNTIGSSALVNVISGNDRNGVEITGGMENVIYGNYIGTDRLGEAGLGNLMHGIYLTESAGKTYIGEKPTEFCQQSDTNDCLNVISGNGIDGIRVDSTNAENSIIKNNLIGVNRKVNVVGAAMRIPNEGNGITLQYVSNVNIISNIVSGNDGNGITLSETTGTKVRGNSIGTNGVLELSNNLNGMYLLGTTATDVGVSGPTGAAEHANVISGNELHGIHIKDANANAKGKVKGQESRERSNSNSIAIGGNRIGTNRDGNAKVPNGVDGIYIEEITGVRVGVSRDDPRQSQRNTISGNLGSGIQIASSAYGIEVLGNHIGVSLPVGSTNNIAMGNTGLGVVVRGPDNQIGDVPQGLINFLGNRIGGNGQSGIGLFHSSASNNQVVANFIGRLDSADPEFGNQMHGIVIADGASNNVIGGDYNEADPASLQDSSRNEINGNGGDGVRVESGVNNSIRFNSISNNDGLGINLSGGIETANSVTQNDRRDGDEGANNLQNFPVLNLQGSEIFGWLDSTPLTQFVIDVYKVDSVDPSGHGEGKTWVESVEVTTDIRGFANFEVNQSNGTFVATATQLSPNAGSTSEFSAAAKAVSIVDQEIFYNDSEFDDGDAGISPADANAASGKSALLPGQTATFDNYTSYSKGINGIFLDVRNLAKVPTLSTVSDFFEFRVGNESDPDAYVVAPAPTGLSFETNVDLDGTDRIFLTWADNAIQKQWLQVTWRANDTTGLANPFTFYFGNAIGETGNDPANAQVNLVDVGLTRANQTGFTSADIENVYDFDRDGRVNLVDVGLARANQSGFSTLKLISPPADDSSGFSFKVNEGKADETLNQRFKLQDFSFDSQDETKRKSRLDNAFASMNDDQKGSTNPVGELAGSID